jgi:hypothetical protein
MLLALILSLSVTQAGAEPVTRPATEIEQLPTTHEEAVAYQQNLALRIEGARQVSTSDAADTPASVGEQRLSARDDDDGDDGGGSVWLAPFKYYYPLELDSDLEPETESKMVLIWILTAFAPYGAYWSPYLFDEPGDGLLVDVLISALAHSFIITLPLYLFVIPIIGWIVGYVLIIGLALVTSYYLMPVAVINLYDRSLKRKKAGLGHPLDLEKSPLPSGEKKRKKRRGSDKIDDDDLGGDAKAPLREPTVVYAY